MLCSKCEELTNVFPRTRRTFRHYNKYTEMRDAAVGGCQFCSFMREAVLKGTSHYLQTAPETAEERHVTIDQEDHTNESYFLIRDMGCSVDDRVAPYSSGFNRLSCNRRWKQDQYHVFLSFEQRESEGFPEGDPLETMPTCIN